MNHPQLVTNIPIRRGFGIASLRRKVQDTHTLLKPEIFSQSPQVQRPTLHSQKSQVPSSQRVTHLTSVEGKQPLSHRPRAQSRS